LNTVFVTLTENGPMVLNFRSSADSFLSNVLIVAEKLRALGHDVTGADLGKKFFVGVY